MSNGSAAMPAIENRAQALCLLATFIVATSFPVGAAITQGLDSVVLTLLRFALSIVVLAPIVMWKYGIERLTLWDLSRYATISALLVVFFAGMFEALRYTSPLNTATLFTLTPMISAGAAAILLGERPSSRTMVALGLGLAGAVWVIYRGDFSSLGAMVFNKGDVIFLIGTVAMGFYGSLVKVLHRGEPMAKMTFWVLVTGTVWLLILSLPRLGAVSWSAVPSITYYGIIYLACFTAVTFFIFQWSTLIIGPTKVMSYTYLHPTLVLLIGLALGDEAPPLLTYPGFLLVIGATFVLQRAPRKFVEVPL